MVDCYTPDEETKWHMQTILQVHKHDYKHQNKSASCAFLVVYDNLWLCAQL